MTPLEKRAIAELDDLLEQIESDVVSLLAGHEELTNGGRRLPRIRSDADKARNIVCAIRDSQ